MTRDSMAFPGMGRAKREVISHPNVECARPETKTELRMRHEAPRRSRTYILYDRPIRLVPHAAKEELTGPCQDHRPNQPRHAERPTHFGGYSKVNRGLRPLFPEPAT